jgi:hypothetical protein
MNDPAIPDAPDKELAKFQLQAQTQHAARQQDIGKMGAFFGSRDNAVIYLAWSIIILGIIGGTILAVIDPDVRGDMAKAFAALTISALGYMFGRSGNSN